AHPHFDASGKIALVHNGVIENYQALKEQLIQNGDTKFRSDTDTEVLAHLIGSVYQQLDGKDSRAHLVNATRAALKQVIGTYGIALVHADIKDFLVGARRGSPSFSAWARMKISSPVTLAQSWLTLATPFT